MAEAPTLIVGTDPDDEICLELLRLESVYVAWETWIGVSNLIYARRKKTSPPRLVKADNTAMIWEQVRAQEREVAVRRGEAPPADGAPGSTEGTTQ